MRRRLNGFMTPDDHHGRPAFGPRGGPFDDEFGHEFGPGRRGGPRRGHGGPGRRGKRGDVRSAILTLLAEQPRHGYEIIGEISQRSGGFWKPSPGSIYPTLQLLADEGLVQGDEEGGKRLFQLTDDGRAAAEKIGTPPWEHFTQDADPNELRLRAAAGSLMVAIKQVSQVASSDQRARATDALDEARRTLYGILGEAPSTEG
ncbi:MULTISPECIES: PadR family transcriptional regulator [Prauserella salsuginis group]|uniref:DNA-binding PadR family transcriptional regulator n=2 Tax=Prauserella salsuginis group TaxID=2893672 RepID=A0A839XKX5_9PSEU|nr:MULTISPECIES: PadR family transcriptional regulator [Prauserella salsuginis group]MBB3661383.1 DNA-binding PadR family transcriptional regulator [Prauserella sediminis]MCR3719305.1 DNA-binding transcriptional regulator, PadR family [Prauserella flava]MCR3735682.1 DNA-binding transcriptional regulator, PadR family [Prauserella salsuginis]